MSEGEFQITVELVWEAGQPASVDDCRAALVRSGVEAGGLIGECMVANIDIAGGDDDDE